MSNRKRKPKNVARRLRRRLRLHECRPEQNAELDSSFVAPDIHREIRYITRLAQAEDSRIVTLGNLVLFSTRTRDAWLLDREDHFAVCLCRDSEPQPVRIVDGPDAFAIEWTARIAIKGPVFTVHDQSGRVIAIHGYPTSEITAALEGRPADD